MWPRVQDAQKHERIWAYYDLAAMFEGNEKQFVREASISKSPLPLRWDLRFHETKAKLT